MPHRRPHEMAVAHDRRKRAEGSRREADGKGDTRLSREAVCHQGRREQDGKQERYRPGKNGMETHPSAKVFRIYLIARIEKEEGDAQIRQERDSRRRRREDACHVRPQKGTGKDEKDHFRHSASRNEACDIRRCCRYCHDQGKGYERRTHETSLTAKLLPKRFPS